MNIILTVLCGMVKDKHELDYVPIIVAGVHTIIQEIEELEEKNEALEIELKRLKEAVKES